MTLRDPIGFDAGSRELEQALDWAERDKLCPACLMLPPAPQGNDDQPA
jgi:hypothetical protein